MSLSKHLFKEVYLVGVDHTVCDSGELAAFDSLADLLEHLRYKSPSIASDIRVVHGVLTSARSIPGDLGGRTVFLVVCDSDVPKHGVLLDSDAETPSDLAKEIELVMENPEVIEIINIDDIFILYGYEINTCLAVDEDDFDEDMIKECLAVAKAAQDQLKKSGEN